MDRIPTDFFCEVSQVNLSTGERRSLLAGDEPFDEDAGGIARIVVPGGVTVHALEISAFEDSMAVLLIPTADVDGDELFKVRLDFYTGRRPVVTIAAREPLPRAVVEFVAGRIAVLLLETTLDESSRYPDLAYNAEGIGIKMLRSRIRRVEQSVRDALADEQLTSADYQALREYPVRLARVEHLAAEMADAEPEMHSFKPPPEPGFPSPIGSVGHVSFYNKWVNDAAADARDAVTRMSGLLSSQQIVLTQKQAEDAARFQRLVTIVGAAVLVPGLVAAIFGANVGFRGRDSTEAFWAMLVLMIGSGVASYALIRSFEIPVWRRLATSGPLVRLSRWSDERRLVILGAVALLLVGLGFALLSISGSDSREPAQPSAEAGEPDRRNAKPTQGGARDAAAVPSERPTRRAPGRSARREP